MFILFYKIEEIALEVLKNEIDFALFLEGLLDANDVVSFQHF